MPLVNPNVETRSAYDSFITTTFPLFTTSDVNSLNAIYKIDEAQPGDDGVRYDTNGLDEPTALNQSEMATGIQQVAFAVAAENVFDCPAQWLAEAFSTEGRVAWKYQYSVTPAYHGADLPAYFAVGAAQPNAEFRQTFQKILGSFIMNDSPVISARDAKANRCNATVPTDSHGDLHWPPFTAAHPWHMNLNTTGGTVSTVTVTPELSYFQRDGPGIVNNFSLANALAWEAGRGARCDFWRTVSLRVPQ